MNFLIYLVLTIGAVLAGCGILISYARAQMSKLFLSVEATNQLRSKLLQEAMRLNALLGEFTGTPPTTSPPTKASRSLGESVEGKIRVSMKGQEVGPFDLEMVKSLLAKGKLTSSDTYYDEEIGEWVGLDTHPEIAGSSQLGEGPGY